MTAEADGTLVETGAGTAAYMAFYGGALQTPPGIGFLPDGVHVDLDLRTAVVIPTGQGTVLGTSSSVPEPPTAILLVMGLVGLVSVYMRARGRQRAAV